jgi:hypothetical protein
MIDDVAILHLKEAVEIIMTILENMTTLEIENSMTEIIIIHLLRDMVMMIEHRMITLLHHIDMEVIIEMIDLLMNNMIILGK